MRLSFACQSLLVVLGFTQAALAHQQPEFSLIAESPHFLFYSHESHAKASVHDMENWLSRVEGLLGETVPGKASYFQYDRPEDVEAAVGVYAAGVTLPEAGEIHSTLRSHRHEVVHLVASRLGDPGRFFQEGLAVALAEGGKWRGHNLKKWRPQGEAIPDLSDLISHFEQMDPEQAYPIAGSFVESLLERYGTAKLTAFFKSCECGADLTRRELAFQDVYGETLDEAKRAWAGDR